MDSYTALIAAHIVLAIVWVGGALMVQLLDLRGIGVGNRAMAPVLLPALGWIGTRILSPSSVLVVVTGALLAYLGGGFQHGLWIDVSLALSIATVLLGAAVIGPSAQRVHALLASGSTDDGSIETHVNRMRFAARLELLLMLAIVALMVFKPF